VTEEPPVEPAVLWLVAGAVLAAPVILLRAFHRHDTADARGRRTDTRWRC
jgi:hypothetical protein